MFEPTKLIRTVKANQKLFMLFLLINAIVIGTIAWKQCVTTYEAKVKVIFNGFESPISDAATDNYLFNTEDLSEAHYEFVHLLESDSLLGACVDHLNLVEQFNIPSSHPNPNRAAQLVLRNSILVRVGRPILDPSLTLRLRGKDRAVVERILLFLIDGVQRARSQRVIQNLESMRHQAKNVAKSENGLAYKLSKRLNGLRQKKDNADTISIVQAQDVYSTLYKESLRKGIKASNILNETGLEDSMASFHPFYVTNLGVKDVSNSMFTLAMLSLIALIISLIFEIQLVMLWVYIKAEYSKA